MLLLQTPTPTSTPTIFPFTPTDAITANQFFILSIALALSTYISTVSREVERSIKTDIRSRSIFNALKRNWQKIAFILGLFLSDALLWAISLPIATHISKYFSIGVHLPSSYGFFIKNMGFLIWFAALVAFFLHLAQWIFQLILLIFIFSRSDEVEKWIFGRPLDSRVISNKSFKEHIAWAEKMLTTEQLAVYLVLANTTPRASHNQHLYIVKTIPEIEGQSGITGTALTDRINELKTRRFIECPDPNNTDTYGFPIFYNY